VNELIDKDIPRTAISNFSQPSLIALMEEALDGHNVTLELKRVLYAFVDRNPAVGYEQGMSYVAMLLLCFMSERHVFWVLCAIFERLRTQDFYLSLPSDGNTAGAGSGTNGYTVEVGTYLVVGRIL
jgi:hypothetical protein